ncbi:MAG: ABC transporter ATP-binding protein [Desulfarculus sp.]|nr:ABC transporter ATP-binding protein [Desulfarculus sp.]
MPSPDLAIATQDLGKRFGTLQAVRGLSLGVAKGESFALVGPDGAGKTTTIRMLCGIMDPDQGSAQVLGLDAAKASEAVKERIGYMPQRFGLYDDLTVDENLAFYADLYQVPEQSRRQRVPELLGFSNLTPFRGRLAGQLSGGMRQKLGLACALVHTPELLILDEPTCGVDPVSRREFWHILYRLLGGGMTIFVSTAYLDEAERAHRVGLMHRGRLLVADAPAAVRAGFQGQLMELRLEDLAAGRRVLEGHPLARRVLARGDRLMVTVGHREQDWPAIEADLRAAGLADARALAAEPSLEDLFVQIIAQEEGPA